jgi:hypothetical protein
MIPRAVMLQVLQCNSAVIGQQLSVYQLESAYLKPHVLHISKSISQFQHLSNN